MFKVYTLCVLYMFKVYTLCVVCVFKVYKLCVLYMFKVYKLCIVCVFKVYKLCVVFLLLCVTQEVATECGVFSSGIFTNKFLNRVQVYLQRAFVSPCMCYIILQ